MKFTLHQIHIFKEVAHRGSITRAAEALFMTQPAVSIQMKQLQKAVGIPLIDIVGRQLQLTDAGKEFLELCNSFTERLNHFDSRISQLKGGLRGKLTISAASTAKYFLPYHLGRFQKKYDQIDISLKVTNRNEVLRNLESYEYDLAILSQIPDDPSITAVPFLENPLVIAAHRSHPLRHKTLKSLNELSGEPFIFREKGSGTRMVMERLLKRAGIQPKIPMELGTNEAVKQAIMAGIGISLISELSLIPERASGRIATIDIEDYPVESSWYYLYNKNRLVSPVTQNFISFLSESNPENLLPQYSV